MDFEGRKIEASNLPEIDSFDKSKIESALILSFDKLQKITTNEMILHAHFKQHETDGTKTKHTVHLKLSIPGNTFVASETGWILVSVLQKALSVLERETVESVKRN